MPPALLREDFLLEGEWESKSALDERCSPILTRRRGRPSGCDLGGSSSILLTITDDWPRLERRWGLVPEPGFWPMMRIAVQLLPWLQRPFFLLGLEKRHLGKGVEESPEVA